CHHSEHVAEVGVYRMVNMLFAKCRQLQSLSLNVLPSATPVRPINGLYVLLRIDAIGHGFTVKTVPVLRLFRRQCTVIMMRSDAIVAVQDVTIDLFGFLVH
uniref:hypothetical protein n=1 Tax=Salmonella enterica TaxID=28901 RepID=UPI001C997CDF